MDGLGGPTHVLATADDPAHAIHRKSLISQLAAKRVFAHEPFIAETSAQKWGNREQSGTVEWMSTMANRLPMMIVGRIIGVPHGDIDNIVRWGYTATQLLEGLVTPEQLAAAGVAVMKLTGYIAEQFRRAATEPRDDLFNAGGESAASLIGSAAWVLARYPDIQQQVREN